MVKQAFNRASKHVAHTVNAASRASKELTDSVTAASKQVTDSVAAASGQVLDITDSLTDAVNILINGDKEKSYEELKKIEAIRRKILRRHEVHFFRMLCFWNGTVLRKVSKDPLMYITILIYILVRIGARVGLPDFVSDLGGADIAIIGAFLSFLLVFFVNNSAKKFDEMYEVSMSCEHNILDITSMAKTTLPRAHASRLVRYLNAAHIAGYIGLSETYTKKNFFDPINEANHFLSPNELARIEAIDMDLADGSAYRELITWCCHDVNEAFKEGYIDPRLASHFRDLVLKFQGAMASLYDAHDQRVSFSYLHFICMSSALYLPLFAISSALDAGTGDEAYWLNDIVAGLIVTLQCLFVIGLRILAVNMNAPYGAKTEDLSVMYYINHVWRASTRILNADLPGKVDANVEEEIRKGTQDYGRAWGWKETYGTFVSTYSLGSSSTGLDCTAMESKDLNNEEKSESTPRQQPEQAIEGGKQLDSTSSLGNSSSGHDDIAKASKNSDQPEQKSESPPLQQPEQALEGGKQLDSTSSLGNSSSGHDDIAKASKNSDQPEQETEGEERQNQKL